MLSNIETTAENIAHPAREIVGLINDVLNKTPTLKASVQGYTEFTADVFNCNRPIEVNNLFGPRYWASFDPFLKIAIEDVKKNQGIDKTKLHAYLLEKYLGIQDVSVCQAQPVNLTPNAYHTIPAANSADIDLHAFFLQPYKLFAIADANRKFRGKNIDSVNREWLWMQPRKNDKYDNFPNESRDSAPIFRKIIQIYILCSIIQDYQDSDGTPFRNDAIQQQLPTLKLKYQNLINQLKEEANQFLLDLEVQTKTNPFVSPPVSGLIPTGNLRQWFDNNIPGLMENAHLYPIGRLLFGQPTAEPHHLLAQYHLSDSGKLSSYLFYSLFWIIAHLNLSTSYLWLALFINNCLKQYRAFQLYITYSDYTFYEFCIESRSFFTNVFIFVSSPLLILLPWIYGLTSLPFSLIRALCLHGPFSRLNNFSLLKFLDFIEAVKDALLLSFIALPFLETILLSCISLLPKAVILGAITTSQFMLVIPSILPMVLPLMLWYFITAAVLGFFFATGLEFLRAVLSLFNITMTREQMKTIAAYLVAPIMIFIIGQDFCYKANMLHAVASTSYFTLVGASLQLLVPFLGLAILFRLAYPRLPPFMVRTIQRLAIPFNYVLSKLESFVADSIEESQSLNFKGIIPTSLLKPPIQVPQAKVALKIPDEVKSQIDPLTLQLSHLAQSFHFSPERKKIIREHLAALDENNAASLEDLNLALQNAKELLSNNFNVDEMKVMDLLVKHLKENQVAIDSNENVSLIRMRNNASGAYQPSWKMLTLLQEKGIFNSDGSWKAPNNIEIPQSMQDKCSRIKALSKSSIC
ncbi:MAG: hypothetical protein JSS07_10040 [Proteobacteria bacterium]|nr:hypothetical protein [Pseudomonadota bacterium]